MQGQRYRMKTAALAIADHTKATITIPTGAEIEVIDGRLDGNRLVNVVWEGTSVKMFTNDIYDRGEPVDGAAA
jgi:hypothetical protein